MNIHIDDSTSRVALYEDQTLCAQLLKTITAATPLQILPSKIPGAGVGLFVTKDINHGEEIFRSDPVVNCVRDGMQSLVCDQCYAYQGTIIHPSGRFRTADDTRLEMKACSGCKVCYYCSRACQKKAWKLYHKFECTMFSKMPTMYPRTRALYRLLNLNKHQLLSREQWLALHSLQSHIKEHLSTANAIPVIEASEFVRTGTDTSLSSSGVLILHCTLLTNCLSIYQTEGLNLGTSLDVVASLINHSCDPNVFVVFEGNSLRVRSIRKLRAGEEITQCYTDVDTDVLIRRQRLKSEYFFDCRCDRCEQQIQKYGERYSGMIKQIEQSQQQLLSLICAAAHVDSFETDAQDIAKQAFSSGNWPDDLEPWPSLRIRFAWMLEVRGRSVDALKHGVRGYLWLERRTGDIWIRHLSELLQIFTSVLVLSKQDIPYGKSGFPTERQLWDVLHGYLHELARGAIKTFGAGVEYTQAIQAWYSDCIKSDTTFKPGTRGFVRRFNRAQSSLLLWAGVDENRGIALT